MRRIDQIKNNSVICFLGDSITANGIWINEIIHYLVSDFKDKNLKLYNCGISGDNSAACMKRVYRDCLSLHPDYVVLMLGMNDIGVDLYKNDSEENLKRRQSCIEKHKENMTALMDVISRNHAKLILCTPTICGTVPNNIPEVGDFSPGLEACSEFIREQAEKNGYMLIDFNEALWNYANLQEPIISGDCVHPTNYGYHIMAQLFMVQMGIKDTVDLEPYTETNQQNKERFRVEQIIANVRFCEYAMRWSDVDPRSITIEERKNWIREFATLEKAHYWTAQCTGDYLLTADSRDEYIGKLIELTNAMYREESL